MTSTVDSELTRLEAELLHLVHEWRVAKATFAAVTGVYRRRHADQVTAELLARSHPDRVQAVADAAWYQAEIQTTALAILALRRSPCPLS